MQPIPAVSIETSNETCGEAGETSSKHQGSGATVEAMESVNEEGKSVTRKLAVHICMKQMFSSSHSESYNFFIFPSLWLFEGFAILGQVVFFNGSIY